MPTFAVVGHPNKGKSSIVATLAEDERVAISPAPGTTRSAARHTFTIDGEEQYALVDTPGFQRPGEVLKWLKRAAETASDRAAAVADFVDAHRGDDRFLDECELLTPLVQGAGILYVVDGAKPYGPEYELEMEILRWTGRPRMALINMIGSGDYQEEWRQALDQYFSIVRVFDAMHADFDKRVSLLRAFAELDERWRGKLEHAVAALTVERQRRQSRSAAEIAGSIVEMLTAVEQASAGADSDIEALKETLVGQLRDRIRSRERLCLERIQKLYRHESMVLEQDGTRFIDDDIFTRDSWQVFGLSQSQLALTGALSGAAAGGGIDLALGGSSLFLGAGLGALVGGASAWWGSGELARVRTVAGSLGERVVQVGPVSAGNFPWVLLGRAWLHHGLVAERNHARREAVALAVANEQHLMNEVPDGLRRELASSFRRLMKRGADAAVFDALAGQIERLLSIRPATVESRTE